MKLLWDYKYINSFGEGGKEQLLRHLSHHRYHVAKYRSSSWGLGLYMKISLWTFIRKRKAEKKWWIVSKSGRSEATLSSKSCCSSRKSSGEITYRYGSAERIRYSCFLQSYFCFCSKVSNIHKLLQWGTLVEKLGRITLSYLFHFGLVQEESTWFYMIQVSA